jgi:proton-dependent oligopeptide transporter, POT family
MQQSASARMPAQILYMIGNEARERFSFYGMRNFLTPFLRTSIRCKIITAANFVIPLIIGQSYGT